MWILFPFWLAFMKGEKLEKISFRFWQEACPPQGQYHGRKVLSPTVTVPTMGAWASFSPTSQLRLFVVAVSRVFPNSLDPVPKFPHLGNGDTSSFHFESSIKTNKIEKISWNWVFIKPSSKSCLDVVLNSWRRKRTHSLCYSFLFLTMENNPSLALLCFSSRSPFPGFIFQEPLTWPVSQDRAGAKTQWRHRLL